jgi:hypothetical protein
LQVIRQSFFDNGFDCLHFTSDNGFPGDGWEGSLEGVGVLQTANFQWLSNDGNSLLDQLRRVQPDMPIMAMEFWAGWYGL